MKALLRLVMSLVLLLTFAVALKAQQYETQDEAFLNDAAENVMAEIELSGLAIKMASSEEVRKYAQGIINDNKNVKGDIDQMAKDFGLILREGLHKDSKQQIERLAKYSGAEFDREYMNIMVRENRRGISDFWLEYTDGKHASLVLWAGKKLPMMKQHLRLAQETAKKIMGSK
jgi:putative membrane protein